MIDEFMIIFYIGVGSKKVSNVSYLLLRFIKI